MAFGELSENICTCIEAQGGESISIDELSEKNALYFKHLAFCELSERFRNYQERVFLHALPSLVVNASSNFTCHPLVYLYLYLAIL